MTDSSDEEDPSPTFEIDEVTRYLGRTHKKMEGTPGEWLTNFDIFAYWNALQDEYPTLYRIAIRYISVPCASSFCERMFSTAGKIPPQCGTESVEARIQLAHNFHVVEANELEDVRVVREGNKLRLKPLPTENDPSDFLQSTDLPDVE
jgi:hypothetical protein